MNKNSRQQTCLAHWFSTKFTIRTAHAETGFGKEFGGSSFRARVKQKLPQNMKLLLNLAHFDA